MKIFKEINSADEVFYAEGSKPAFSLAEGLVMLVVVSVLLAVSAPLIARKSQADSQKAVRMQNEDVISAFGDNQQFTLGNADNAADNEKLIVYGQSTLNGDVVIGNNFRITEDAVNHRVLIGLNGSATPIVIDTRTGETNIPTGAPDFTRGTGPINNGTIGEDAFVYEPNSINNNLTITINSSATPNVEFGKPTESSTTLPSMQPTLDADGKLLTLPKMTPVRSGSTINCTSGCTLYPMAKYSVGRPQ